ncbi:hypothetical protein FM106_15670 [Brachybacterium faecium]|nr:hypothetical protein FM106_15670 [Brachybacterium faecium]
MCSGAGAVWSECRAAAPEPEHDEGPAVRRGLRCGGGD